MYLNSFESFPCKIPKVLKHKAQKSCYLHDKVQDRYERKYRLISCWAASDLVSYHIVAPHYERFHNISVLQQQRKGYNDVMAVLMSLSATILTSYTKY